MKIAWSNARSIQEARYVIFGVPDESASHSQRKGASKAPYAVRAASPRSVFYRQGRKSVAFPPGFNKKVFDVGDIAKNKVADFVEKIVSQGKKPIAIGGDHSITTEVLKGIDSTGKKVSIAYFDSHPDFICSTRGYHGSVVCDINAFKSISFASSIEIGVREVEHEELVNLRKKYLQTITPEFIAENGVKKAFDVIKKRVRKNIYISIDADVVDPAFAPGVSTPVPGGLSSVELIYLVKKIASLGLIGLDVVEVTPKYDFQEMTAHLAAKTIVEAIASDA